MQRLLIAALALVVGAVIGAAPLRAEARRLQARIEEVERRNCGPGVGSDLGRMLRGVGSSDPSARPKVILPPETDTDAPRVVESRPDPDERGRGRRMAKAALELRRTQARAALEEQVSPSDAQLDSFDAAIDQMNGELTELADELAARLEGGEMPSRHDQLAFAADALDILVEADANLRASLDPDQLESVDDAAIDPFSYVDPSVLDRLDKIEAPK